VTTLVTGPRFRLRGRPGRTPKSAAWWAGGVLVMLALVAIIGPMIYSYGPNDTDLLATGAGPSWAHPFGTDDVGRDLLARILSGARISLISPLLVMLIASTLGTVIAVSAAWLGGRFDSFVGVVVDISLAFPSVLLAVLVVAFAGPGLVAPVAAMAIAYVPYSARIIRSRAIAERSLPYIEALHIQGFRGMSICVHHLIPNIMGMLAALSTLTYGYAMVDLAAISFLGLGVQPPQADWGSMVSEGKSGILAGSPHEALAAGGCIVIAVIAVNILGEALADRAAGRNT